MSIKSNGTLVCPVGWGDISQVLHIPGSPTFDPNNPCYDLGYMITNGYIKEMAKWKPVVKSGVWGVLSASDRAGVRYGFGTNLPAVVWSNSAISAPTWTYVRPSGGNASPFRSTDFAKDLTTQTEGYNENVVAPIGINLAGTTVISATGALVEVKFDRMADSSFNGDYNLSATDLLGSGGNSYLGYNLALILEFPDRSPKDFCLVVYNQTMASILSGTPVASCPLSPSGDSASHLPAIPKLASCSPGERVRVIACLSTGRTIASGDAYAVFDTLTNEVSLAFVEGADREEFAYNAAGDDWSHLASSIVLTRGNHHTDSAGMDWSAVSAYITIAADQYWQGTAFNLEMEIICDAGDANGIVKGSNDPVYPSLLLTPQQADPDAGQTIHPTYTDLANIQLWSYTEGAEYATYSFVLYGYFTDHYADKVELCRGELSIDF